MDETNVTTTRHPDVYVRLTGRDSNVFYLLGRCTQALKSAGHYDDANELAGLVMGAASFDEALHHMTTMVAVG